MGSILMDSMVACLFCLADLPVYFRFANQLKSVFLGLNGLEDHIKLQSFQWQNCPKPIIGLDVHKLGSGNRVKVKTMLCRAAGRNLCTLYGEFGSPHGGHESMRDVCACEGS